MKHNPVNWFEIYVQDMARARTFYESVLQLKLGKIGSPDTEMWGFPMDVERFGAGGSLVKMEGVPSGGNSTIVYFICADCAVEARRVEAAGGRIHKPKMSIGEYGFMALAFDTEGNMFGLHSMRQPRIWNLRQGHETGRHSILALRTKGTNDNIEVSVGGSVVDVAEGIWG